MIVYSLKKIITHVSLSTLERKYIDSALRAHFNLFFPNLNNYNIQYQSHIFVLGDAIKHNATNRIMLF